MNEDMTAKFSRSAHGSPLGKRTDRVEFSTDPETKQVLRLLATQAGANSIGEYVNDVLTVFVHGRDRIKESYTGRIDLIAQRISEQFRGAEE